MALAMRTTGAAGLGAGAQRLIDDGLDGARATAALGAASEAPIELLGIAGKVLRTLDDIADIVVAKHVARTDNHLKRQSIRNVEPFRYKSAASDAKAKTLFSSNSKLIRGPLWNESKKGGVATGILRADARPWSFCRPRGRLHYRIDT
jgi:hypothetical protein